MHALWQLAKGVEWQSGGLWRFSRGQEAASDANARRRYQQQEHRLFYESG